jgi:hypothetical protein
MFGQPPHRHERNLCDRQKVDPAVSLRGEGPEVRNDRHYRYGVKIRGDRSRSVLQRGRRELCRFSDAGKTCSPRAHGAGVRKAPRHEIAVGRAPGGASSAMGIWAGRGCQCDLMAAVWMIALGQKIAESTLNARPVRCASGFGVGLRAGVARRCKRERCRARASQNGGGRCGGGSMVPAS